MRPKALIDELDLLAPIYKPTAAYGHFGRCEFPWEKTDRAAKIADDLAPARTATPRTAMVRRPRKRSRPIGVERRSRPSARRTRRPPKPTDMKDKVVVASVVVIAIVRAATGGASASVVKPTKPMTPELAHDAYRDITSRERQQRREAAVKFPGDLWSQDDDFHERENESTRSFAGGHEVAISDVVRAVDDGMREHWPTFGVPQATVPPCRPRLSY